MSDRIKLQTFRAYNPVQSKSDVFYCGIANSLLKIICAEFHEFPVSYCQILAISLANYYDDVMSDVGTWRAFTETHQERYGRPLPFYDLTDIDEYYPDEIHEQDVRFLLWHLIQSFHDDQFINPENERIGNLAHKITAVFFEKYYEAPINFELLTYLYDFEDVPKDGWMFKAREIALWLCCSNYLTAAIAGVDIIDEKCEEINDFFKGADIEYCARAYVTVNESYGPLNMNGFKWFAAMCRNADLYNSAELYTLADDVAFKELSAFKVESYDKDTITFRGADGDCFTMDKYEIDTYKTMSVDETLKGNNCIIGAFLRWGGNWLPWGFLRWQPIDTQYLKLKEIKDANKLTAEIVPQRIQEKCGDKRMFYLKNIDELPTFHKKMLGVDNKNYSGLPDDFPNDVPVALWLDDATGDFSIIPYAQCLNDPNNPYYDQSESPRCAFEMIMIGSFYMDKTTMDYLVNQGFLRDAACISCYGEDRGHQLVQENIKFLCDYFRSK